MCNYECEMYQIDGENLKNEVENNSVLHWNYRNLNSFPLILLKFGKHLEDLYLKGNCIQTVPESIIELEHLVEIHLGENKLKELPESISNLQSLRILEVNDNEIRTLPKTISNLTELYCLNVSNNHLTDLPDLSRLKYLWYLHAKVNNLTELSSSVTGCDSLRELDLEGNKLTSLPKLLVTQVYMPNLQFVSVRSNRILYLPAIPFRSLPILLAEGNENLNHISYNVEYLRRNDKWPHLILDESHFQYVIKKSNESKSIHAVPEGYSFIRAEITNNDLIIPLEVHQEHDAFVPPLLELCLREIHSSSVTNNRHTAQVPRVIKQLPHRIRVELEQGPTSQCQKCGLGLFKFAFVRILWDSNRPKLNIVQYFCTKKCLQLFKNDSNSILFVEIPWAKGRFS